VIIYCLANFLDFIQGIPLTKFKEKKDKKKLNPLINLGFLEGKEKQLKPHQNNIRSLKTHYYDNN
jgi:hypothetical protein